MQMWHLPPNIDMYRLQSSTLGTFHSRLLQLNPDLSHHATIHISPSPASASGSAFGSAFASEFDSGSASGSDFGSVVVFDSASVVASGFASGFVSAFAFAPGSEFVVASGQSSGPVSLTRTPGAAASGTASSETWSSYSIGTRDSQLLLRL